jgi:hypothetical protein
MNIDDALVTIDAGDDLEDQYSCPRGPGIGIGSLSGAMMGNIGAGLVTENPEGWVQPKAPDTKGKADTAPKVAKAGGTGWPAAVTPQKEAWAKDPIDGRMAYRVHSGVTLSGLSATYLNAYERWREIWDFQRQNVKGTYSADNVPIGTLLRMPDEAIANAEKLGVVTPAWKKWLPVAGGVAALGVIGVLVARART